MAAVTTTPRPRRAVCRNAGRTWTEPYRPHVLEEDTYAIEIHGHTGQELSEWFIPAGTTVWRRPEFSVPTLPEFFGMSPVEYVLVHDGGGSFTRHRIAPIA